MLKTLIILIEVIVGLVVFSVIAYLIVNSQVLAKAQAFCDTEVVIGKSADDLTAKAKKVGAKPYRSSPELLMVMFSGSARPILCNITITKNIVTAKRVEVPD